jgi:hypothetical protein
MMKYSILLLSATILACGAFAPPVPLTTRQVLLMNKNTDEDDPLNLAKNTDDDEPLSIRRAIIGSTLLAVTQLSFSSFFAPSGFTRIPTQFIAALGNPEAKSGTNAKDWGLWREDPGPPGVYLKDYANLVGKNNGYAPAGWIFNKNDWWLEEHGIIMPSPDFPMPPGKYLVTGGRFVTTSMTIQVDGSWSLEEGTLYDVTHLPCRSARYKPMNGGSPATAKLTDFPVFPGATMPSVEGCDKLDYAVLFIIGKATTEEIV